MLVRTLVVAGLGLLTLSTGAAAQTPEQMCQKIKPLTGASVQSPKGTQEKPIKTVTPTEMFRIASGYYCDYFNDLPAMYAHSGNKIKVVGPNFEKEFDLQNFEQAVNAWRALLTSQHYSAPSAR